MSKSFEDLNAFGKTASDYYTEEEMVKFKKPKKKKSLRKKEKLDYDALEVEAKSAGLGFGDLGSRNDGKRQALKEEQERNEAEMRSSAYQSALAKADEASKALRLGQTPTIQAEEDESPVIGDDDDELQKSLQRARKLALQKQGESVKPGPQSIALLASSTGTDSATDNQNSGLAESQESKVVFTEMDEFVWGLQFDEGKLFCFLIFLLSYFLSVHDVAFLS
jgi:U4/U6.U5 tri-snRNP-associated protein 1